MPGCVYVARNRINGKEYVGWTSDLKKRKREHERNAELNSPLVFCCAIRKYGWGSFQWRVLFQCNDRKKLKEVEVQTILSRQSFCPNGYNMTLGGDGFTGKHSEESKKLMSMRSKSGTKEVRRKISRALTGRAFSVRHRMNLSNKAKQRTLSKEHRKRLGDIHRGTTLTEAHKQKIRQSKIGTKLSQETKERLSRARIGQKCTEATKETLRAANLGKKNGPPSEETRQKIADSVKRSWNIRRLQSV